MKMDIRGSAFAELMEEVQGQIDACMKALDAGTVDSGTVTIKLGIELKEACKTVVDKNMDMHAKTYKQPKISYTSNLTLKKEDKQTGNVDTDNMEIVFEDGRWIMREAGNEQMKMENLEE